MVRCRIQKDTSQPQRVFIAIIGCNLWKSGVHMATTKKSGKARNAPVKKPKNESAGVGLAWIKERLKKVGRKSVDLCTALELPAPRISEKLNGRAEFDHDEIPILARVLEMPLSEVQARLPYNKANALAPKGFEFVTVCGAAKAGLWMKAIELAQTDFGAVLVPKDAEYPYIAALRVTGDDMENYYPIDSIAVYAPYSHYKKDITEGQHVVVERSDGAGNREISIKELRLSDDGKGVLLVSHSKNPDYQPVVLSQTDGAADYYGTQNLKITGIVLKVMRDYKPESTVKNARKLPGKL